MSYHYDTADFSFPVVRKHFFSDRSYSLYLFQDDLVMTDKPPKYVIPINLTTTIKWVTQNQKIIAMDYPYQNRRKIVHAPTSKLQLLKDMIAGRVFYESIVDFYVMQMELGRGMMGSVSRCVHLENHEFFAVKVIEKNKIAQHEGGVRQPQFIHELSLLGSLRHPNIVKLKEVYADPKNYYIVMEYINGRTLSTELQNRQCGLSINESIRIMGVSGFDDSQELLAAVQYIHERGIMHRDLNPLNIMWSDTVKLIDFGLARKIKNQLIFPTSGTPGYMAPEIINFSKAYDEKADIFSLGCVLYKLLTGEHLFSKAKCSLYQANKEGAFELKKPANHPEINSVKMDQLFVLMQNMLELEPQNRISARVCLTLLTEIENNCQQIDKLIKKIRMRGQLTVTSDETMKEKPRSTELMKHDKQLQKTQTKHSMDWGYRKSIDEMSVFTAKQKQHNQQQVLLTQPNISIRKK